MEFIFDTQLLIEGHGLNEDSIHDYIIEHFDGDCLLAVGDNELIKIHFHINEVNTTCYARGKILA